MKSNWKKVKIREFLHRYKEPVEIKDYKEYKQVTIRTNHQGIEIRKIQQGKKIGTKKQFIVHKGLFLMSKIDARYGAFGIVPDELEGGVITGNFWAYEVNQEIIDIDYFNQYTNSPDFYELCERASSGITHRKYLQEKDFLKFEIEIPNLDNQKKILNKNRLFVDRISTFQKSINHRNKLLQSLRQQVLQDAITGKLSEKWRKDNPSIESAEILLKKIKAEKEELVKDGKIRKQKPLPPITENEILFALPEGWVWCRLGEVTEATQGIQIQKSLQTNVNREGYIRYLYISDFESDENCKFVEDKYPSKIVNSSDLVMANTGATAGKIMVGKYGVLSNNAFRISSNTNIIDREYLYYFLLSDLFLGKNNLKGAANPHMGHQKYYQSMIPICSLLEQRYIVSRIEWLFAKLDRIKELNLETQTNINLLNQVVLKEMFQE